MRSLRAALRGAFRHVRNPHNISTPVRISQLVRRGSNRYRRPNKPTHTNIPPTSRKRNSFSIRKSWLLLRIPFRTPPAYEMPTYRTLDAFDLYVLQDYRRARAVAGVPRR